MTGISCPRCHRDSDWISTVNQWEYKCMHCDIRFNRDGQVYTGKEPMMARGGSLWRELVKFWRLGW